MPGCLVQWLECTGTPMYPMLSCSLNLDQSRVHNTSLPLPALQRLNAQSSNLYRTVLTPCQDEISIYHVYKKQGGKEQKQGRYEKAIIYTTKIEEFVCPPNISETVAVRIMKLTRHPRIASTTIKLISKPILLSILSILLKTIQ